MKPITCLYLFLVIALGLSSCVPAGLTTLPAQIETQVSSPTPIPPTSTSTFTPTATATPTLPATLEPEQAQESIRILLQEPIDCEAPCFWRIEPGRTTLDEAINTFAHLGISLKFTTTISGKDFYSVVYNLGNGLEVTPIFTIQNNIVENLRVGITPDKSQVGVPRKWLAYSPETLISRYGLPSKVVFSIGRGPSPWHSVVLYFETVDLIVEYSGASIINDVPKLEICLLTNQVDLVQIWMGDNPQYPPKAFGVPLEEATSLTMQEFVNLMIGNPKNACFNLKEKAFP